VALTLYTSAFLTEIWRGCVDAIPKGQWEASQSLALSFGEQLALRDPAAGAAHRDPAHGGLSWCR
jgi:ABC-type arginine/histidine transport system permease subunit